MRRWNINATTHKGCRKKRIGLGKLIFGNYYLFKDIFVIKKKENISGVQVSICVQIVLFLLELLSFCIPKKILNWKNSNNVNLSTNPFSTGIL